MFEQSDFEETYFNAEELEEIDETASAIMATLEDKDINIAFEALQICGDMIDHIEKEELQKNNTHGLNGFNHNDIEKLDDL